MAARESQGLQVALILFVMVTVVLAVTTYVYFRKSEELIKERDQARNEKNSADARARDMDFKIKALKHVLGHDDTPMSDTEFAQIKTSIGGDAAMKTIFDRYDADMKMYGQGLPADGLCYLKLPENLITKIRDLNSQIVEMNSNVADLTDQRDKVRVAEENRTKAAVAGQDSALADLASERTKFNEGLRSEVETKDRIAVQLDTKDKAIQQISATSASEIEARDKQIVSLSNKVEFLEAKAAQNQPEQGDEKPDGKITWVNQRSATVAIDLGAADGLQQQMTFSVYDQNERGAEGGKVKGRIEVTRITDDHIAEGRIVEDILADPILPGDFIASASFRKGQQTHFAITGFIDMDRDGKSDLGKLKALIALNSGVVDAELRDDKDGTVAGKMTINTRYLIQGEKPTDKLYPSMMKGHTELIDDAGRYGIEIMPLDNFLNRMGYSAKQAVVPLNRGGGSGGASNTATPPKPAASGTPGSPASPFRPRTAPKSAY